MTENRRLSAWGWFVRAFAAGFGAAFGVIVAGLFAGIAYAVLVFAAASVGSFSWSATSSPPSEVFAPADPPSPYSQGSASGANTYSGNGYSTPANGYGVPSTTYPPHDPYGGAIVPPSATAPPSSHGEQTAMETAPANADDETPNTDHSQNAESAR